jgi:hypothetical protein
MLLSSIRVVAKSPISLEGITRVNAVPCRDRHVYMEPLNSEKLAVRVRKVLGVKKDIN